MHVSGCHTTIPVLHVAFLFAYAETATALHHASCSWYLLNCEGLPAALLRSMHVVCRLASVPDLISGRESMSPMLLGIAASNW